MSFPLSENMRMLLLNVLRDVVRADRSCCDQWRLEPLETRRLLSASINYFFAHAIGSTEFDWARATTTDASGNLYVAGDFMGTVDVDPGSGVKTIKSDAGGDAFIAKYTQTGSLLWAQSFGGNSDAAGFGLVSDGVYDLTTDAQGNLYATGVFYGTTDFDASPTYAPLTANGGADAFVMKLDPAGNLLWASASGTGGYDRGTSISVDGSGNVTAASVALGDSIDTLSVHRYTSDGTLVWTRQLQGSFSDPKLTTNAAGHVFLTGSFSRDFTDFDPGAGVNTLSTAGASSAAFLTRWDANGNHIWAHGYGTRRTASSWANDLALDSSGNVLIVGGFTGMVDFDPSPVAVRHRSSVNSSVGAFFNKVDGNGNFIFNRAVDGPGFDEARAVTMVANDNFIAAGVFEGEFDFNSASGTLMVRSNGGTDAFVAKFSRPGYPIWAATSGGEGYDFANDVTTFRGAVTIVGGFEGTADFDPDPTAVQSRTSRGSYDFFMQRLIQLTAAQMSAREARLTGASLFSSSTQILGDDSEVLV